MMSPIMEPKRLLQINGTRKRILVSERMFDLLLLCCVQLLISSLNIRSVVLKLQNYLEDLLKYSPTPRVSGMGREFALLTSCQGC